MPYSKNLLPYSKILLPFSKNILPFSYVTIIDNCELELVIGPLRLVMRIIEPGVWSAECSNRLPEIGNKTFEAGNMSPESGNETLEAGSSGYSILTVGYLCIETCCLGLAIDSTST